MCGAASAGCRGGSAVGGDCAVRITARWQVNRVGRGQLAPDAPGRMDDRVVSAKG